MNWSIDLGRVIDYLKMDIEGHEGDAIPQIVTSGMLANIRQLGFELHLTYDQPLERIRSLVADVVQAVEVAGMVRFDSKANPWSLVYSPALNHTGSMGFEIAWYQILPY